MLHFIFFAEVLPQTLNVLNGFQKYVQLAHVFLSLYCRHMFFKPVKAFLGRPLFIDHVFPLDAFLIRKKNSKPIHIQNSKILPFMLWSGGKFSIPTTSIVWLEISWGFLWLCSLFTKALATLLGPGQHEFEAVFSSFSGLAGEHIFPLRRLGDNCARACVGKTKQ